MDEDDDQTGQKNKHCGNKDLNLGYMTIYLPLNRFDIPIDIDCSEPLTFQFNGIAVGAYVLVGCGIGAYASNQQFIAFIFNGELDHVGRLRE